MCEAQIVMFRVRVHGLILNSRHRFTEVVKRESYNDTKYLKTARDIILYIIYEAKTYLLDILLYIINLCIRLLRTNSKKNYFKRQRTTYEYTPHTNTLIILIVN